MATTGKVANRYAKALFDELKGKSYADSVLAELEKFASTALAHEELSFLIDSPGFSEAVKTQIVGDVASKMQLSNEAARIVVGLSRMGRVGVLAPILERLRGRLLENKSIQSIRVSAVGAVSEEDRRHIETKFEKVLGKKVEATYDQNPSLVAGLRVVAGGRTFDGSVSGWLETLKERLVEGEA